MASVPAFSEMREQLQGFLAAHFLLPQVADQIMGYINDFAAAAGRRDHWRLAVSGPPAYAGCLFHGLSKAYP